MEKIKKLTICPNQQFFVTYSNNTSAEINAAEVRRILDERQNHLKKWSLVGNIEIVQFFPVN